MILVINKTDKVKKEEVFTFIDAYKNIYDFAAIVPVSARSGENTDELIRVIMQHLPYGLSSMMRIRSQISHSARL